MQRLRFLLGLALATALSVGAPAAAQAPLRVVTTLPDLADLTRRIGGARVEVKALASPGQNLHAVRVKPSHLVAVSRADVFVQVGLSLEHAWVPGLLESARNRAVAPGGAGFIDAGVGFATIDVPEVLDRSQGVDVHPQGNPHVNLSLEGGAHFAAAILAGLERVAPQHADEFRANHALWRREYERAHTRWVKVAELVRAKGAQVTVVHKELDYLLRDLGLGVAAALEPKPGLAPTPAHLATVIETMRARKVKLLVTAAWSNDKSVARVAEATGAEVLVLPLMAGGSSATETWLATIDACVDRLARAVGVDPTAIEAPASDAAKPPGTKQPPGTRTAPVAPQAGR
jgi:zinc/manganese transport system substrate-binding protein